MPTQSLAMGLLCCLIVNASVVAGADAPAAVPYNAPKDNAPKVVPAGKLTSWIRSGDDKKRRAALREIEWGSADDADVVAAIGEALQPVVPRKVMTETGFVAIEALSTCPLPEADQVLGALLKAGDWRARLQTADVIAKRESGGDLAEPLLECWQSPYAAENYALRHALVLAIAEGKGNAGLATTIDLLPQLDGQLKFEAVARLTQRTGENFGDQAEEWKSWWSQRPAGWTPTVLNRAELPKEVAWEQPVPEFYGVKIYAKRVLFVVDMSNSMRSTLDGKMRITTAQEELQRAISALPEDAWFDVIFYNDRIRRWRAGLVPATAANRFSALQMIFSIDPERRTAINEALETAFDFTAQSRSEPNQIEQVLLLSDGKPTAGRIVSPSGIVMNITARNVLNRIRFDSLGIDSEADQEQFLTELSQNNFGKYYKLR